MERVLIFVPKPGRIGGMEMHLVRLALLYAADGVAVTLVATGDSLDPRLTGQLRSAGVTILTPCRPSTEVDTTVAAVFIMRIWLGLRMQTWDLILTNSHSFWAFALWLLASPRTRIVHHHHTTGDALEQLHWRKWYFLLLKLAPLVLTCSEFSLKCVRAFKRRGAVCVMPYLIAENLRPRPRLPLGSRRLRIGYIGRLVRTKGIDRILELSRLPELDQIEWRLYGSLGDYQKEDFLNHPRLSYEGAYAGEEALGEILGDLDAVVLFSEHAEGMPVSLLEAAAAGLPWIASDIGGVAELAHTDPRNQLVPRKPTLAECRAAVISLAQSLHDADSAGAPPRDRTFDVHYSHAAAVRAWRGLLSS